VDMGEELSGKLIMQEENTTIEWFREMLFSFGAKCWVSKEGNFRVGRKSLDDFVTDVLVFEQYDLLAPVDRKMGLTKMVNIVEAYWDYIPIWDLFKGAETHEREELIDRYGPGKDRIGRRPPKTRRGR